MQPEFRNCHWPSRRPFPTTVRWCDGDVRMNARHWLQTTQKALLSIVIASISNHRKSYWSKRSQSAVSAHVCPTVGFCWDQTADQSGRVAAAGAGHGGGCWESFRRRPQPKLSAAHWASAVSPAGWGGCHFKYICLKCYFWYLNIWYLDIWCKMWYFIFHFK